MTNKRSAARSRDAVTPERIRQLAYQIEGSTDVLSQLSQPIVKSDAECAVKQIEGTERVDNQIDVLPL